MSTDELHGTKLALVLAAGELFAEHGVNAVGIRKIAEKAGANGAAVNYHFGSKENLYAKVLLHVARESLSEETDGLLQPGAFSGTDAEAARAVRRVVKSRLAFLDDTRRPRWHARIMMRAFLDSPSDLRDMLDRIFRPGHNRLRDFFRRLKPGLAEEEAQLLALSLTSHVAFFAMARDPVLLLLQKDGYDPAFLKALVEHVCRLILARLDLPQFDH